MERTIVTTCSLHKIIVYILLYRVQLTIYSQDESIDSTERQNSTHELSPTKVFIQRTSGKGRFIIFPGNVAKLCTIYLERAWEFT